MPMAEVFYGMTAKGHSMTEILREINAKLKRILPVGVFCCATLANISFQRRTLKVWNGGLPDGYLLHADGCRVPLVSRHLPLGVLEPESFDDTCETFALSSGDRLFLLSDGVLEAENAAQQLFGEGRLLAVFDANRDADRLFEEIQQALGRFRGQAQDDVSMIEVDMVEEDALPHPPLAFVDSGQNSPLDWSASFEFRAETLRRFNPLPFILQLLLEVRGLRAQGGALYSVLAELYSNALEHGVMGLDSSLKRDAAGFGAYYRERGERLAGLDHGFVRFHLHVHRDADGGCLEVGVEDSGAGFDVERVLAERCALGFSGRGLALVRELTERCAWEQGGRLARAVFRWA
ncbi:Stage II sporulation protein E (SpoIIE) [compost metagenome]